MSVVDKRDLGSAFRNRLRNLLRHFDGNQAEFADSIGLDRSALSQLLSDDVVRLPRAETLCAIAQKHGISLDWLLGLHHDDEKQFLPALEIGEMGATSTGDLLSKWAGEATGHKVRYVPSTIPIPYRTKAVANYEMTKYARNHAADGAENAGSSWFEKGLPEDTEMDICMPVQQLMLLAEGKGYWGNLDRQSRSLQIDSMADQLDKDYPTVRLYLYCEIARFSITYVQYGPEHASIFTGGSYLVVNDINHIRKLRSDFDDLIRQAVIGPEKSMEFLRGLHVT